MIARLASVAAVLAALVTVAAQAQTDTPRRFGQSAAPAPASATPASAASAPAAPDDPLAGSTRRFGQSVAPAAAKPPAPAGARRGDAASARTPAASAAAARPAPVSNTNNWPLQPDPDAPVYIYQGKAHAPLRVALYRWPAGQSFKRIEKGGTLAREYWLARYFARDYAGMGLAVPASGFEWVRFGPDILMIDLNSGVVTEAIAGFFSESPNVADIPLNGG